MLRLVQARSTVPSYHPCQERDWVLQQFKDGDQPLLIATDVAQRGLDIKVSKLVSQGKLVS